MLKRKKGAQFVLFREGFIFIELVRAQNSVSAFWDFANEMRMKSPRGAGNESSNVRVASPNKNSTPHEGVQGRK